MILNGQAVGGLTVYHIDAFTQASIHVVYSSFKTTLEDIKWSDSRRVNAVC